MPQQEKEASILVLWLQNVRWVQNRCQIAFRWRLKNRNLGQVVLHGSYFAPPDVGCSHAIKREPRSGVFFWPLPKDSISGYLSDQKNQRWMVYVGTLWMAVLLGFVGVIKNYPLLVIIIALAGLGTALFHPQASAMVTAVSGERKGFFQSLFVAAGNCQAQSEPERSVVGL